MKLDSTIIWKYIDGEDTIIFEFNNSELDTKDLFFRWVNFMNAIGYNLNKVEMENMWNGE